MADKKFNFVDAGNGKVPIKAVDLGDGTYAIAMNLAGFEFSGDVIQNVTVNSVAPREDMVDSAVVDLNDAANHTVLSGVAARFLDLTGGMITNNTEAAAVVELWDDNRLVDVFAVPAGISFGFVAQQPRYNQDTVNQNWIAKATTGGASGLTITLQAWKREAA